MFGGKCSDLLAFVEVHRRDRHRCCFHGRELAEILARRIEGTRCAVARHSHRADKPLPVVDGEQAHLAEFCFALSHDHLLHPPHAVPFLHLAMLHRVAFALMIGVKFGVFALRFFLESSGQRT